MLFFATQLTKSIQVNVRDSDQKDTRLDENNIWQANHETSDWYAPSNCIHCFTDNPKLTRISYLLTQDKSKPVFFKSFPKGKLSSYLVV